jgi:DNA-binding XRE family transcriptional regulator
MSYGYSVELIKVNKQASRKSLGVRLGRVCIAHNIPVQYVARKLKVSRQTVYNWFVGTVNPRPEFVPLIDKFIASHN